MSSIFINSAVPIAWRRAWVYSTSAMVVSALGVGFLALTSFFIYFDIRHLGFDDAYTTYRYAANLAEGRGFVFNANSAPVLGTSTPLYTLLLAIGGRFGADIPLLSMGIGALATALTMSMIVLIASRLGYLAAGIASALSYCTSQFAWAYVEGMETPVYSAIIVAALFAYVCKRPALAMTIAALAVVTRMDGMAIVVAIGVGLLASRQLRVRDLVPCVVILSGWFVITLALFGSPIPTSGFAKMLHETQIAGRFDVSSPFFFYLLLPVTATIDVLRPGLWAPVGERHIANVLVLAGFAAVSAGVWRIAAIRPAVLWLAMYSAGFLALRMPDFSWYHGPSAVVASLVLWIALQRGVAHLGGIAFNWNHRNRDARMSISTPSGASIVIVAAVVMATAVLSGVGTFRAQREAEFRPYRAAGEWLAAHRVPGDSVVAFEIGTVAYFSDMPTIDILGLTEPRAWSHLQKQDYAWAIREDRPTYVFTTVDAGSWPITQAIFADPTFTRDYELVARFPLRSWLDYGIYRRLR